LDVATRSGGLRLSVLGLLDDGLEPSTEGSNLCVVRHGDRTGHSTGNEMNSVAWTVPTRDEQYCTARVTVVQVLCRRLGLAEEEKNSGFDYHVNGEGLSRNWMILLGHRRL
jgi:hypothetical protein